MCLCEAMNLLASVCVGGGIDPWFMQSLERSKYAILWYKWWRNHMCRSDSIWDWFIRSVTAKDSCRFIFRLDKLKIRRPRFYLFYARWYSHNYLHLFRVFCNHSPSKTYALGLQRKFLTLTLCLVILAI